MARDNVRALENGVALGNYFRNVSCWNDNRKENQMNMSKYELLEYSDAYLAFVLGYDLLHDELVDSDNPENDYCFDYCLDLVDEFKVSDEYRDETLSLYEALEEWLNNRKIKGYDYLLYTTTVKDLRNYRLEDNDTSTGGTAYDGETLGRFALSLEESEYMPIVLINERLKACGIKQIRNKDIVDYMMLKSFISER